MYPIIYHLHGPFNVNTYGVFIALGLFVLLYFAKKHQIAKQYLDSNKIQTLFLNSIVLAIFGGRILHLVSEWKNYNSFLEMFYIWNGGLSSLGAVIAVAAYLPYALYKAKLSILPILDLAGIYVPLFHSIARIGCFFAGCCFGTSSQVPWAVCYTNAECFAPLNIYLHPTQIYSSIALLCIFLIIRFISKNYYKFQGQLAITYLMFATIERFFMDFLRGDRNLNSSGILSIISLDQLVALCICALSLISLIFIIIYRQNIRLRGSRNQSL